MTGTQLVGASDIGDAVEGTSGNKTIAAFVGFDR